MKLNVCSCAKDEKMVLNQVQDQTTIKIVETFQGGYKLTCDQLVDMYPTQN